MNKCKKANQSMADAIYNQLPEVETLEFNQHIKNCTRCMEKYLKIKSLIEYMDKRQRPEMSDQFWSSFSSQLENKLKEQDKYQTMGTKSGKKARNGRILGLPVPWILYPASALAILILGIGIGRYLLRNTGQELMEDTISPIRRISPKVAEHFDNIQPLLIDYSNYAPSFDRNESLGGHRDRILVDKDIIKQLLMENQLLKQIVARENNISVKELLEELELVLLELSNSKGDKEETNKTVKQLIEENDLLFKIKVLKKKDKEELTI